MHLLTRHGNQNRQCNCFEQSSSFWNSWSRGIMRQYLLNRKQSKRQGRHSNSWKGKQLAKQPVLSACSSSKRMLHINSPWWLAFPADFAPLCLTWDCDLVGRNRMGVTGGIGIYCYPRRAQDLPAPSDDPETSRLHVFFVRHAFNRRWGKGSGPLCLMEPPTAKRIEIRTHPALPGRDKQGFGDFLCSSFEASEKA